MHRDSYCIQRLQAKKTCKGCGGTPAAFNYYVFDYCVDNPNCASRLISIQILPFSREQKLTIQNLQEVIKKRDDDVIELLQRIRWRDDQIEQLQYHRSRSRSSDRRRSRKDKRSRSRSSDRHQSRKDKRSRSRSSDRHQSRKDKRSRGRSSDRHQSRRDKRSRSRSPANDGSKSRTDKSKDQILMLELDEFLARAKDASNQKLSQPIVQ
jgi:hypothetical protein